MIVNAIVVDTNLIFSALLLKNSKIRDALYNPSTNFYAPNFLIVEIFKHKDRILQSSKLSESEFYEFFNGLIERITFVPLEIISVESRQKAYLLCHEVDINDIPFISLALELDIPFWTGDIKLMKGLQIKGYSNFYRIEDNPATPG